MTPPTVLILSSKEDPSEELTPPLEQMGLDVWHQSLAAWAGFPREYSRPDLVLVQLEAEFLNALYPVIQDCRDFGLPCLLVLDSKALEYLDESVGINDFVLTPIRASELMTRAGRLLRANKRPTPRNRLRIGELTIDPERYEVTLANRRVPLTFKEYQLLLVLATNPERVYTREDLLSQVWGYDYYGGTRTVDVHVRRLRSKIEDPAHLFIETIRNVGYRFCAYRCSD